MSHWAAVGMIAACVVVFYWVPMTSRSASIQWDAADLHYPLQKYLSDHIRSGSLPTWTPYLCAGYPFLAYPETGAWYPLHWPFFLIGITPRAIQIELAVNAFVGCLGAFALILRSVKSRRAAMLGSLCYGLSGFFAGHASHVGIFIAACWFPWLLLTFRLALDSAAVRYTAIGGLVGAAMLFAGYTQTAMYGFLGLGLYALADLWFKPRRWLKVASVLAGMLAIALTVAAVQVVPALELWKASIRQAADYSRTTQGILELRALPTLLAPDWLGAISGNYSGPFDITQYYFYAGFLALPLATLGVIKGRARSHALLLIIPPAWFMLGPAAGLFRLISLLPGVGTFREPIQGWFVVALGLALLASAGLDWILQRWSLPYYAGVVLLVVVFVDQLHWNSFENPLAYARNSFETLYGVGEDAMMRHVVPSVAPLTRLDHSGPFIIPGPRDQPLCLKLETTYGYAALQIADYMTYRSASQRNLKLRDGLNVSAYIQAEPAGLYTNPSVLPRAYFPKAVTEVASRAEAQNALETLDPSLASVAISPHDPLRQDPAATATIVSYAETSYRIRYRALSPSLLRLSVPWYPGWHAAVNGKPAPIVHVDLALMGVVVPPGNGELDFYFRSSSLLTGGLVSFMGVIGSVMLALKSFDWRSGSERYPRIPAAKASAL
jgi:hypothetical protein